MNESAIVTREDMRKMIQADLALRESLGSLERLADSERRGPVATGQKAPARKRKRRQTRASRRANR